MSPAYHVGKHGECVRVKSQEEARKMSYTPEPWTYQRTAARDYLIFSGGFAVATVYPTMRAGTTFDHDARLIAAAPSLLAACKAVLEYIAEDHPAANQLEEAIDQAEGKR